MTERTKVQLGGFVVLESIGRNENKVAVAAGGKGKTLIVKSILKNTATIANNTPNTMETLETCPDMALSRKTREIRPDTSSSRKLQVNIARNSPFSEIISRKNSPKRMRIPQTLSESKAKSIATFFPAAIIPQRSTHHRPAVTELFHICKKSLMQSQLPILSPSKGKIADSKKQLLAQMDFSKVDVSKGAINRPLSAIKQVMRMSRIPIALQSPILKQ